MLVATVLLYTGLAGCSILAVALVMRYDLHRREPVHAIVASIAGGALAMGMCMAAQNAYVRATGMELEHDSVLKWAILAGVAEESAKFLTVCALAFLLRGHFDEPIDGLIYGSMAGLGAAILESARIQGMPEHLTTLPREEPIRLLGHLVMGGIGGFGVGLVLRVSWRYLPIAALCLAAAIALHIAWDVVAYRMADQTLPGEAPSFGYNAASIALMIGGFFFFRTLASICPPPIDALTAPANIPPPPVNPPM